MPVEFGFCDVCREITCEDEEQCELERQAIAEEERQIAEEEGKFCAPYEEEGLK